MLRMKFWKGVEGGVGTKGGETRRRWKVSLTLFRYLRQELFVFLTKEKRPERSTN